MPRTRSHCRVAFTLIELLVVIAIIAVLIGLLLPAIQKVRESAARTKCQNNLKQIGVGFHSFNDNQGYMPSAGSSASGNPANDRRDFGWSYEILPYIEQAPLHSLEDDAAGANDTLIRKTPVATYYCPSRRPPGLYRDGWAKTDYAGNGGSTSNANDIWRNGAVVKSYGSDKKGLRIRLTDFADGHSNTMLVGEKLFNKNGSTDDIVDNEAWAGPGADLGGVTVLEGDIVRCVLPLTLTTGGTTTTTWCGPLQDADFGTKSRPSASGNAPGLLAEDDAVFPPTETDGNPRMDVYLHFRYGSAHPSGMQAVFGDGSVKTIRYQVDRELFMRIANRYDGQTVDLGGL